MPFSLFFLGRLELGNFRSTDYAFAFYFFNHFLLVHISISSRTSALPLPCSVYSPRCLVFAIIYCFAFHFCYFLLSFFSFFPFFFRSASLFLLVSVLARGGPPSLSLPLLPLHICTHKRLDTLCWAAWLFSTPPSLLGFCTRSFSLNVNITL